ncbi:MAG: hypothetical protein WKG07_36875 [Hymenobacter sp.]
MDYTSGATLLLNRHIETDLVNAEGKAYGVEVSLRKTTGKLNGWLNYTYARSLVRVNTGSRGRAHQRGQLLPQQLRQAPRREPGS